MTDEQREKIRTLRAAKKTKLLANLGGGRQTGSNVSSITQSTGDNAQQNTTNDNVTPVDAATQVTNGSANRQGVGRG